jgi:hypothetical protein
VIAMPGDTGAMTTGQIGRYSVGWAGKKKKKKERFNAEAIRNAHMEKATKEMRLEEERIKAIENVLAINDAESWAAWDAAKAAGGGGAGKGTLSEGGAKTIMEYTNANSGGTFEIGADGKPTPLKNGYMVPEHPELGEVLSNPTEADIDNYANKHAEALKGKALGTWKEGGKLSLDVTSVFPLSQEQAAIKSGFEHNQKAIGKLVDGKYTEIKTYGTGTDRTQFVLHNSKKGR